ncbi:MAG: hydantoinase B/oxoprolinase family protein [Candidatus Rokubacteria bacterium]|nr:hydantoinase B/oxoprolinase family protein [Candidatus Rokubacteria bacterium]
MLQNHLLAAAEEMGIVLVRAAYSPNIKERRDSSTAILDAGGEVVAQAAHIPMHLSSMMALAPALFRAYPPGTLGPGDMFVANDPYVAAGSHLNDLAVIAPVFVGRRLVALVANAAHHADVGGRVPGSESGDSRTIYQDGLRLPVARLARRGRIEDGLFRTILLNSRTPDERVGDLRAQMAANRAGAARVVALARAFGLDTLVGSMRDMLRYTERRVREGLRALPRGTWRAEGETDDDGVGGPGVPIRLALTVGDGELVLDFSGTGEQVAGAKNVPLVSLLATIYYAVKAVVDPDIPANAGYYRAIRVVAPEGTVLNPRPPAAVAARFTTCQKVADVVLAALAGAAPARAVARSHGGTLGIYSGTDPRSGAFFVDYEVYAGGGGARATKDGWDAMANHTTNTSNLPIESLEREYPLLVERYELRADSEGPGRFRGGLGATRVVRGLGTAIAVGGWGCDQQHPPAGLAGGAPGEPGAFEIDAGDGRRVVRSTVAGVTLAAGGRLTITTAGGGGYGDPLAREPAGVLADVREGKITAAHARDVYAVALRGDTIDATETEALRAARSRETADE